MALKLNIRQKFFGVSLATSILSIGLALGGLGSAFILTGKMADNAVTASALRNHLEADMMHDALRGDVLAALHAARGGETGQRETVQADIAEHVEMFRERVAANKSLPLPAAVGQALAQVDQPLVRYVADAERIVWLAFENPDAAMASLPAFSNSFKELEDAMSEASDRIEGASAATEAVGRDAAEIARIGMLAALATAVLLSITSYVFANRSVIRPVQAMTLAMTGLARGDKDVTVPARDRTDELGAMAEAVQVFKDNALERERLQAAAEAERVGRERRTTVIESLVLDFDRSIAGVLNTVAAAARDLNGTAQDMTAIAEETNRQSAASASASDQASANVQVVASAADELAASIQNIGLQVGQSAAIADEAAQEAARTQTAIHGLAEAAQRIGDVVQLVTVITQQTRLLALNATIEAARAGELGKGFAVVAGEVKALADQTAKATEEIAGQITAIQTASTDAVRAITGIGTIISRVNAVSGAIASAVTQQRVATSEIARNVQQAAVGCQAATSSMMRVTEDAGQARTAAGRVLGAAGDLSRQASELQGEVERFLSGIRGA
jgi:methyl-accepting chemotaxis protein